MIKSVRLVNFFSFGDCTIDLESDLNVLVGINGSGKSNFLRAFQLLKAGMDGKLKEQIVKWGGLDSMKFKKKVDKDDFFELDLYFTIDGSRLSRWPDGYKGDIIYHITLMNVFGAYVVGELVTSINGVIYLNSFPGKEGAADYSVVRKNSTDELMLPGFNFGQGDNALAILAHYLRLTDIYKAFNTTEDAPMRNSVRATGVDKLLPNGDNMFQILNTTGLKSTTAYDTIEAGLQDVNSNFQRFRMNVYGQGSVEFYLQEKGLETPIHAAQVSDGTLCYLCLLVALYQPDKGELILFDEPERNLHPDMLFELGRQLEKASEKSQIILTTHVPGLVNQFPLRAVRVFEKDENNQTIVNKFTEEDFAGWYDEFAPGQMWRDGALGGNR
ncbi:MAG: AAA family ATPase [Janthinobacterium lividum]